MRREPFQSMQKERSYIKRAFTLIEVMLAIGLLALAMVAFVGAWLYGEEATKLSGDRAQALYLSEEGLEAVRNMRDHIFTNLTNGPHGLAIVGNQWTFSGISDVTGVFTRSVSISSVDLHRKIATSTVTWQQNQQRTGVVTLVTELTHWLRNWAIPLQLAITDLVGTENGQKIQVQGNYAYVIRTAAAQDFLVIDISNPLLPAVVGQLSLSGDAQNIYVTGSYAYVASTDNAQELQIVNIITPTAPTLAGSFNDAGTANATGVYVVGTTAYLTLDGENDFVTVNVATPSSPTLFGALSLSGVPSEVVVMGTHAYLASSNNAEELQVINVSSPSSPTQDGLLNLSGSADASTITGFGSTIVIGRAGAGGIAVISVATPTSPSLLGSLGSSGGINDISLGNSDTYVFAATGEGTAEFKVFDITTPSTPALLSSFNNTGASNGTLFGIAHHAVQDRTYTVGIADASELIVYGPQ